MLKGAGNGRDHANGCRHRALPSLPCTVGERSSIHDRPEITMQSYRDTKANWPITLEDLKERSHQCVREASRWVYGYLVIALACLFTLPALTKHMKHNAHLPPWLPVAVIVLFFVYIIAGSLFSRYMRKRKFRSYDLYCPSCSKVLEVVGIMPIVVATGHCPNCGICLVSNHPSLTSRK